MKKFVTASAIIFASLLLSSCDGTECIRCTNISGTDVQELCSPNKNERNEFQVNYIRQDYNCIRFEE